MGDLTHVTGLSDLQKLLDELPVKVEKNIMRGALRAGVKPIKEAAQQLCPIGLPAGENARIYKCYEGAMRDSIRVTTSSKGGMVMASVKVGGKNPKTGADVYWAHMIEFSGAHAHRILGRKNKGLTIGGMVYSSADHPGMSAHPFMRPALDSKKDEAVVKFGEYIKQRLATKEGLDTSDINIEASE